MDIKLFASSFVAGFAFGMVVRGYIKQKRCNSRELDKQVNHMIAARMGLCLPN